MSTTNGGGHLGRNNISNGTPRSSNMSDPPIFTVDEALPYTPLSSIFQFNSDIIPLPSVGLRSSTSIFTSNKEREDCRAGLESLNREAQDRSNTSHRLEQSLNHLKELLRPEGLARFKFKAAPTTREAVEPPKVALSPFASLVYENTSVEFEYPHVKQVNKIPIAGTGIHRSPSKSRSQYHISNIRSYQQNGLINVQSSEDNPAPQLLTPQKQSSSPSALRSTPQVIISLPSTFRPEDYTPLQQFEMGVKKAKVASSVEARVKNESSMPQPLNLQVTKPVPATSKPASSSQDAGPNGLSVIIPGPKSDFGRELYVALPDSPDSPQHLSRKRNAEDVDSYEASLARGSDEREKADKTLRNFRDFLYDIFEAEDGVQADSRMVEQFFTSTTDGICLNVQAQTRAESTLHKVIACTRLAKVPFDDLLRLQRLSEAAVKDVETLNLSIDESMGSSEVAELLIQLSVAELGIRAARTSLRLMTGEREEKQLYSEDIIQSALNAFKNVANHLIIPVVEMRSSGSTASAFRLLIAEKTAINNILMLCQRLLSLMTKLVGQVDLSEAVVNTLEYTVSQLIFVENASTDKDSVLGVAKFDTLRTAAMDVLCEIFFRKPAQRRGIVNEILSSMEKLPVKKQSARHFKLPDRDNIQHVSALIMRLIQTSAIKSVNVKERRNHALEALNGDEITQADVRKAKDSDSEKFVISTEMKAEQQPATSIQELHSVRQPLTDDTNRNAYDVVNYIVERAMKSTKTGDTPYRNLLDLFIEDFITCWTSPDWPAAELLLRCIVNKTIKIYRDPKSSAPGKNMALEICGSSAGAVADLYTSARKLVASVENGQSELGPYLCKLAEDLLEGRASGLDIASWSAGPFRITVEALHASSSSDSHLQSAIAFLDMEWARRIAVEYDQNSEDDEESKQIEEGLGAMAFRLREMICDPRWLPREYTFTAIQPTEARLAYTLVLLYSDFARYLPHILQMLHVAIKSDQATVRSKGLRSISDLLDKDPTLIEREAMILPQIQECLQDPSVQVRESALNLIAKIISSRPRLETSNVSSILDRISDLSNNVRKRAMRLAKEIYLRNDDLSIRSKIAEVVMGRVEDLDEGVRELAGLTMEEIWMAPFYAQVTANDNSPQFQLAMENHVKLMVQTVHGLQRNGSRGAVALDKVLQNMLSDKAKFSTVNLKVCKTLVATMFETIIDNSSGDNSTSALNALQILETFSKSNPQMFTAEQMQLLQPYTKNVVPNDQTGVAIFRSVLIIYRHVFPHLPPAQATFLDSVRGDLMPAMNKRSMPLDDLVACVSIIAKVRQEYRPVITTLKAVLLRIASLKGKELDGKTTQGLMILLSLAGCFGKHVNFEPYRDTLSPDFEKLKKDPVPKLITDTLAPFASPNYSLAVRKAAVHSIGMVCQIWPENYSNVNIYTSFLQIFEEKEPTLENSVMQAFKDFLFLEEKRSEAEAQDLPGASEGQAKLGVMAGSTGHSTAIAQRFLLQIIEVALTSKNAEQTLLTTEVISSIARQGLSHPKQPWIALVALETSPIVPVSELAFREYRKGLQKHESLFEREYMTAVHEAFDYQRNVVGDVRGAKAGAYVAKLRSMILEMSKLKVRKKFYGNLCSLLEAGKPRKDWSDKLLPARNLQEHLQFSQFIVENLAFFDYQTVEELLSAVTSMEKRVFLAGTDVANSIETEIFKISLDEPSSQIDGNGEIQMMPNPVDPTRLRDLSAASIVLSILGEARTHLRRQYGLKTNQQNAKAKAGAKNGAGAPVKVQFINGDKFWAQVEVIMHALDSEELMMQQCRSFVDLLNHDPDFKIAAEGEEDAGTRAETPDDEAGASRGTPAPPGSGRGRKRKASLTPSTPGGKKKRGRPKGSGKRQSVERSDDEDDFQKEMNALL